MNRDHWWVRSKHAVRRRWVSGRYAVRRRLRWLGSVLATRPARWIAGGVAVLLAAGLPVLVFASLNSEPSSEPERTTATGTDDDASPTGARQGGVPVADVPGLNQPGIHLSVATNAFGELEVVEQVLVAVPIVQLSVAPPPTPEGSAGGRPVLEDVQVSADGEPVGVPGDVASATRLGLMQPTTRVELRYRVVGADARSQPATPGRATLSLRPASAAALGDAPTVVEVHGSTVHGLLCLDVEVERQLCGVDDAAGWHTRRLTADASHVLALVDLPDPR